VRGGQGRAVGPRISAIVLTQNHLAYTICCLRSLLCTEGLDEIVVVDNGSEDGTQEYLHELQRTAPQVRWLRNSANLGTSMARNQGAALASGELLLFFDNDAYAEETAWLGHLTAFLCSSPEVGVVGPMVLYPPDGKLIQSAGGGATEAGEFGLLGRGQCVGDPVFDRVQEVAWVPAASMLIRREVFEAAGGFDVGLGPVAVGEDIDLCLKIRSQRRQIWYVPASRVLHYEGTTFDGPALRRRKLPAFRRNMRVIRQRWLSVIRAGPMVTSEAIRYVYIRKNYQSLESPSVQAIPELEDSFADPGRLRQRRLDG
jgi:GT2 family glycosyltransferase